MQKNKTNVSLKLQRDLTLKITRLSATQSTLSVAYLDETHVQVVEEQAVTSYSLPLLFKRKEKKKEKKKKKAKHRFLRCRSFTSARRKCVNKEGAVTNCSAQQEQQEF